MRREVTTGSGVITAMSAVMLATSLLAVVGAAEQAGESDRRLRAVQGEIGRLQSELDRLRAREEGVLGELERLGAEFRLREAQRTEVGIRLERVESALAERENRIEALRAEQVQRRSYVSFRLRELYKQGPGMLLRTALGGAGVEDYLGGLRYASFLSIRDRRVLEAFRADDLRLVREHEALSGERDDLGRTMVESETARRALEDSRRARERVLDSLRRDQDRRNVALQELEAAATELQSVVDRLESAAGDARLDIEKFKGLLDWPAEGPVAANFGKVVHPRFKTVVPHPGLDIDAEDGAPFESVFDGTVIFASWLRGYGLTAIVDHGSETMSVYAHASALVVQEGDEVLRGQSLGRVGDSGSLRGPYLYFELRHQGRSIDPEPWLRER